MRWFPSKSRRPRPSVRPTPAAPRRSWQPVLAALEDRVQPGDSLLSLLLAHGALAEHELLPRPADSGDRLASWAVTSPLPAVSVTPALPVDYAQTPAQVLWSGGDALFAADPLAGALAANPVASWNTLAATPQTNRPVAASPAESPAPAAVPAGSVVSGAPGSPAPVAAAPVGGVVASAGELLPLAMFQGGGGAAGPGAEGTPAAPSHLGVTFWNAALNILVWEDNSSNETGFLVQRGTGVVFFETIATLGPNETTYADPSPLAGVNFYRIVATGAGGDSEPSNVLRIDPSAAPTSLDRLGGFDNTSGLSVNNHAEFVAGERLIRLTQPMNDRIGTFFWTERVGITSFSTVFNFRIHGGSDPRADGMAFIVQAVDPTVVGPGGGGLAYGPDNPAGAPGIPNSAAVKFDIYNNVGEGTNSTGLFTQGRSPTLPAGNTPAVAPDRSDPLSPADVDLHSGHVFQATILYDGTVLQTTLLDLETGGSASRSYAVNLSRFVSANTAWVGFGGATGGLTAIQDIQAWGFNALDTPAVPPLAATYLGATAISTTQIDLVWQDNSTTETGFRVLRSGDGVTFKPLVEVGPDETTYSDGSPLEGLNYYRVVALNKSLESAPSNTLRIDPAGAPATFDRSGGFDDTSGLTLNNHAEFVAGDRLVRLTQALNDRRGTFFMTERVGIMSFYTSFTFRIHGGSNPRADGMAFIIQANSPTALGTGGGDLAYGGLANSAAVKFDIYQNTSETTNSTGLFTEGRSPFTRQARLPAVVPDQNVPLAPADIDLHSARVMQVDIAYDGTYLIVFITDTEMSGFAFQVYEVNLSRFVNSNTAWVGFGGATGGLNALQDIRSWSYTTPL